MKLAVLHCRSVAERGSRRGRRAPARAGGAADRPAVGASQPGEAAAEEPAATAAAPVRVKAAVAVRTDAARRPFAAGDLDEIIRRPGWSGDRWSVMVVSLDRGDTLFAYGAHERWRRRRT
jgi:hypothetical protein